MRSWPVTYADPAEFEAGFSDLRAQFEIPERFPPEVEAAAADAVARDLPRDDLTDVPFVAIDPAGSRDLDQAFHAERTAGGYRIHYAIADVGSFVRPGTTLDEAARDRGVTVYAPDMRSPLHPVALSEGSASLLAGLERPSVVWHFELDRDGLLTATDVRRAMVRNRAALSYRAAQTQIDDGDPLLSLLAEIGKLRQAIERDRGGVSLNLPAQMVTRADGSYTVEYERTLPIENWNAQVSLLAGMAAAELMLDAGQGLLRTLPAPHRRTLDILRRKSRALSIPFPDDMTYPDWVRSLEPTDATCLALLNQATTGLRGAGYAVIEGHEPEDLVHAAIAAPYTHVTAPLRRLVDRFTSELAIAICAGRKPEEWVTRGLEEMPAVMRATIRKERKFGRAVIDFTEALVLRHRVGERFEAVVVDVESDSITLQLLEPAVVTTSNRTDLHLGSEVEVQLVVSDPSQRRVEFAVL